MNLTKLPLAKWQDSKVTLHLVLQIIGKIRLMLAPKKNHWWHATFYLTATGFTTSPIPYEDFVFEINFDFLQHKLIMQTSTGGVETITLGGLTVADFYQMVMNGLKKLGVTVKIIAKPFDPARVGSDIPFAEDKKHSAYDKKAITQYWQMLLYFYPVFLEFNGRFYGKCTPIHIFWHTFDLAYTRFSGRAAPKIAGMDPVSAESYSHEVISVGVWAGDENLPEPTFYSYTYPDPAGLRDEPLQPKNAVWIEANGSALAILKYHDLIKLPHPRQALLDFFQSAFDAGAKCADWPTIK